MSDTCGNESGADTGQGTPKTGNKNLRAQKNVIPKLITPGFIRQFVGEQEGALLELCQTLTVEIERGKHKARNGGNVVQSQWNEEKKVIDKRFKRTYKIVVKLGILLKNNVFTPEDRQHLEDLTQHLELLAEAAIKTYRQRVPYDFPLLSNMVGCIGKSATSLLSPHMTPKNINKLAGVIQYFESAQFLEYAFDHTLPHTHHMRAITDILADIMCIY